MDVQDVTISVPKRLFKEAQALAVLREKSIGQLLREVLEEKVREVTGYKKAKKRQIKILQDGFNLGTNGSIAISREKLYER
jgi:Asp-tRNA(Asn)/Glu-tRNA(Gln) amidotransferase B subunit